jgi:hypothetical protein
MKTKEDHPPKGLWSNLKHGKEVGGFTWPEIADQMSFYVTGGERKKLTRALERIVIDHQLTSRYVSALARAWGIPEVVLLHGHFDTCTSREALKEQTGFDVDEIVKRWHQNIEQRTKQARQRSLTLNWDKALDDALSVAITVGKRKPKPPDESSG